MSTNMSISEYYNPIQEYLKKYKLTKKDENVLLQLIEAYAWKCAENRIEQQTKPHIQELLKMSFIELSEMVNKV